MKLATALTLLACLGAATAEPFLPGRILSKAVQMLTTTHANAQIDYVIQVRAQIRIMGAIRINLHAGGHVTACSQLVLTSSAN